MLKKLDSMTVLNLGFRRPALTPLSKVYLLGLVPLFLYSEIISNVVPTKYEFLPLMLTSIYCAVAILLSAVILAFTQEFTKMRTD